MGGLLISWPVGAKLTGLEYENQVVEAAFRKNWSTARMIRTYMRIQRNSRIVRAHTHEVEPPVFDNALFDLWKHLYLTNVWMVPFLVLGSGLFVGLLTFGVMMQVNDGFTRVNNTVGQFIQNWQIITEVRSIYRRLGGFYRASVRPAVSDGRRGTRDRQRCTAVATQPWACASRQCVGSARHALRGLQPKPCHHFFYSGGGVRATLSCKPQPSQRGCCEKPKRERGGRGRVDLGYLVTCVRPPHSAEGPKDVNKGCMTRFVPGHALCGSLPARPRGISGAQPSDGNNACLLHDVPTGPRHVTLVDGNQHVVDMGHVAQRPSTAVMGTSATMDTICRSVRP